MDAPASNRVQQHNAEHDARIDLRRIEDLNMRAIVHKTDAAQASVNNATIILGLIGCFTFLALFSFSVNISGFIAEPLITLTDGLEEISRKNYDFRLNFSSSDEFAEVAMAFNTMSERLKNREHGYLSELFAEKQRIETIIAHASDAIIVLSQKQEIVFINKPAQSLFNLHEHKLTGKLAGQVTVSNKLFKSVLENKSGISSLKIDQDGKEIIFKLENTEIFIPNIAGIKPDEVNIARVSAGRIYMLRNLTAPAPNMDAHLTGL